MFNVIIQNKPLKTPKGNLFQVPTLALVKVIEEEWDRDPALHYKQKPLTALVATALDRVAGAEGTYISFITQSLSQDTILFWSSSPTSLVKLQEEKWDPLIKKINEVLKLSLKPTFELSIKDLSSQEEEKLRHFLKQLTIFQVAGFSHLISLTSSFCISFLLFQKKLSPEEAWGLAHLHEREQRRIWGGDQEVLLNEELQYKEFLKTIQFLKLIF